MMFCKNYLKCWKKMLRKCGLSLTLMPKNLMLSFICTRSVMSKVHGTDTDIRLGKGPELLTDKDAWQIYSSK